MASPPTRMHPRRSQFRRQLRSQCGMALIEALVSVLIFSFGVLGLVGLEASAIGFSVDAENRDRAGLLANEIASTMWLNNSVTLTSAQSSAYQSKVSNQAQGGLPSGTLTITPTAGTTNSVDIAITWKPPRDATTAAAHQFTTRVILP
jgi:type IV pilus assembly protein PilV